MVRSQASSIWAATGTMSPKIPASISAITAFPPFRGKSKRRRTADARASAGNRRRSALPHAFMSPTARAKMLR